MRACAIVPAYEAARTVAEVARELVRIWPERDGIIVVDDGSTDGTAELAERAGARVLQHAANRGKGAALRTGMQFAFEAGFDVAVTVDADGQHPPAEALRLVSVDADPSALVLGVRDMVGAAAPVANRMSNRISNFFLALFSGRPLADTQCGLRRYPLASALRLGASDDGYAFEADVILRAIAAGVRLVEVPIAVVYPPERDRVSHFHSVRDPARIVVRVVKTLVETRMLRRSPLGQADVRPAEQPRRQSAPGPRNDAPAPPPAE